MTWFLPFLLSNLWRTAALTFLVCLGIQAIRLEWAQDAKASAVAKVQAQFDAHLAADQRASDAAKEAARQAEADQRAALDKLAAQYEQDKANALQQASRTVDDLRSGNLRLRREWQGCETAHRVRDATASSGEPDGDAGLRETGAGDLVRVVSECQVQRDGLVDAVKALTGQP